MPFGSAGLLARDGPATLADLDTIRQARMGVLKLLAGVNPASDVPMFRGAGVQMFLVQLPSPNSTGEFGDPVEFVHRFALALAPYAQAGVGDFGMHGILRRSLSRCSHHPCGGGHAAPLGRTPEGVLRA